MGNDVTVLIKLIDSDAKLPTQAYPGDACYDVYPVSAGIVHAGEQREVDLGFATAIPEGWEATIRTRSSQGCKGEVQIHPGTIDAGYRGPWSVKVYNHGKETYHFSPGKAIAQVAIRRVPVVEFMQTNDLPVSVRGERGFGSSDKK